MTTAFVETGTKLDEILARTAGDLAERRERTPLDALERRAAGRAAPIVSLGAALSRPELSVIAEIKRKTPFKGPLPASVDAAEVARAYLRGGAAAISVLTDEPFFDGSLADLAVASLIAHDHLPMAPVLRKDFVVDDYQLIEALAFGADAVLLIVTALTDEALRRLHTRTNALGLEAIVEVHDEIEVARAIDAGARIVGINNRDLRTGVTDLAVTERLTPLLPPGTVIVGESGIHTAADAARLAAAGVQAVLIGEAAITALDRVAAVRAFAGGGSA